MGRSLQLSNTANWNLVYNFSTVAVQVTANKWARIPDIVVPFQFDAHVLAVYVNTNVPEGKDWNFAGYLFQKFLLGITVGGVPEADTLSVRTLSLDEVKLVIYPKITTTYSITIRVPKWFKDASIQVWEYTGPDFDTVDDSLQRIEQKVNEILLKV